MAEKELSFQGSIGLEGDLAKLDMHKLKNYLIMAVELYLNTEEYGLLDDNLGVTGIGIDWETLS